jgi:hypothetical protein
METLTATQDISTVKSQVRALLAPEPIVGLGVVGRAEAIQVYVEHLPRAQARFQAACPERIVGGVPVVLLDAGAIITKRWRNR